MNYQSLGDSGLRVSRIAYGCMPLGGTWDDAPLTIETRASAARSVAAALDAGINFFDHADIYTRGKSEEVFAEVLRGSSHRRENIFIQSKCGIRFEGDPSPKSPHRYDFSYEHIMRAVEGSLRRLRTDYLDVLLLHRPDPLVESDEVARAFNELHTAGKVRWFGVSNHTASQIALLQAAIDQRLIVNQVAFNPLHTHLLDEGVLFNQESIKWARNEGTIEYCRLHTITLQAWGALAWGLLSGRQSNQSQPPNVNAAATLTYQLAKEKGVSAETIVIAWVLRHPAMVQAIVGTTQPERIQAACRATEISLSREEWYKLYTAGRGEGLA